jgi:hypothetical protein
VPPPDSDRAVNIFDTYVAAIRETNVDPITDALVDDRGDAYPTRLGEWLQARGNIDAIAVDVVVFNNDIAKIVGSTRSSVQHIRFARVRGTRSADPGCPSLGCGP